MDKAEHSWDNLPGAATAYRSGAFQGATALGMVVLLYERAILDMRSALTGFQSNQIEARTRHINHAFLVLQQLQGALDFTHGGETAKQFDRFYNHVRAKLLEAQVKNSQAVLSEQIRTMSEVRDCWSQAERQMAGISTEDRSVASRLPEGEATDSAAISRGWQA